jgi:hypothetical protein
MSIYVRLERIFTKPWVALPSGTAAAWYWTRL